MEFKCPICGSDLQHERVDDGFVINKITPTGEVEVLKEASHGHNHVYCSKEPSHNLSDELRNAVFKLVE